MNGNPMRAGRATAGFTLVEILVGLTLGLIAIIVMYQVFAVFEGQRRTTTTGSDAQTTGLIGLYQMEAEGRMAGYGLMYNEFSKEAIGSLQSPYNGGVLCREIQAYSAGAPLPRIPAMPIRIVDGSTKVGGSAQEPDDVIIMYANSPLAGTPGQLKSPSFAKAGDVLIVSSFGHNGVPMNITNLDSGDPRSWVASAAAAGGEKPRFIFIGKPQWAAGTKDPCLRLQATKVIEDGDKTQVLVEYDPAKIANPSTGTVFPVTFSADPHFPVNVFLTGSFAINEYKVDKAARQLIYTDGAAVPPMNNVIGEEVVTMQARYGYDDAGVLRWTTATGLWLEPWKKDVNHVNAVERIRAVRVVLVTRGNLPERDVVSRACGAAPTDPPSNEVCVWWDDKPSAENRIDLLLPAGWNNYRYRVYETTIPLRNALWAANYGKLP